MKSDLLPQQTYAVTDISQKPRAPLFSQVIVTLTQEEHIQLKHKGNYFQKLHQKLKHKIAELNRTWEQKLALAEANNQTLQQALDLAHAKNRDLRKRLYGKKSEKGTTKKETTKKETSSGYNTTTGRPRGQQKGCQGHGRTPKPYLSVVEEERDIPAEDQTCQQCGQAYHPLSKTEDSTITEIQIKAHTRIIKRKMYAKACACDGVAGILTAPPAPRIYPKCTIGISVWVEVLINKFLFSRASYNLCTDYAYRGLPLAPGTLTGGLKKIAPLFEPLLTCWAKKQLTEDLFHNDETGWKVFEPIAGKVGYRWYLWVTQSQSVVYYTLAPSRSGDVPIAYFSGLDKHLSQVIVVCDRYSGYKRLARENPLILLAFCWAHVRRDYLDAAKSWPELEPWMFAWVDTIGELYTLNAQRLTEWDDTKALEAQSSIFMERQQALLQATAQMTELRDTELAKTDLHDAQYKVLNSLKNHWLGLTVFLEQPRVPMDNNTAERRMRNPVTGRKNYYGSGSQWSAGLAAMMFSVFQTLLLWQINPHHWLFCYLTACAENGGKVPTDLRKFVPWQMSENRRLVLAQPLPMMVSMPMTQLDQLPQCQPP